MWQIWGKYRNLITSQVDKSKVNAGSFTTSQVDEFKVNKYT